MRSMTLLPQERVDWAQITAISLVKNEEDLIRRNLDRLFQYGITRFVIADNNSSDETLPAIRRFSIENPSANIIIVKDPVPEYIQSKKLTALAFVAASYFGAKWIYPFDADDFLWIAPGPRIELSNTIDFIQLPWMQSHPADHPLEDIEQELARSRLANLFKSRLPKVMFRWQGDRHIAYGAHAVHRRGPLPLKGVDGADLGLCAVHYPIRDPNQFRAKILGGAMALPTGASNAAIGSHWRAAALILGEGDDSELDPLFGAFWSRDAAAFNRICDEHGVELRTLAYIHDMLTGTAVSFPEHAPVGIHEAKRLWSFRPKAQMTILEKVARRIM